MTTRMTVLTVMLLAAAPAAGAAGQAQARPAATRQAEAAPAPAPSASTSATRRDTKERLREIFEQYPPSVAQVLRLDPSLLTRPDYLAPVSDAWRTSCRSTRRSRTTRCSSSGASAAGNSTPRRGRRRRQRRRKHLHRPRGHDRRHVRHRHARVAGPLRDRLPPLAARDEDPDRGAHQDRRSAGVERGPARLHAVAGRPAFPDLVADRPAVDRSADAADGRAVQPHPVVGPGRRRPRRRPARDCGSRRTASSTKPRRRCRWSPSWPWRSASASCSRRSPPTGSRGSSGLVNSPANHA